MLAASISAGIGPQSHTADMPALGSVGVFDVDGAAVVLWLGSFLGPAQPLPAHRQNSYRQPFRAGARVPHGGCLGTVCIGARFTHNVCARV